VRQTTNQLVQGLADHPFDTAPDPESATEAAKSSSGAPARDGISSSSRSGQKAALALEVTTDVRTTAWMESPTDPARRDEPLKDDAVQTAAWTESQTGPSDPEVPQRKKLDVHIPPQVPGSEAPLIVLPKDRAEMDRAIHRVYPELPPLPDEPVAQPGPEGKPYTLADLQRLAAENSPTLRQAASDVEAAKGNLIQAMTYPNPTLAYLIDPTNNNATAGVQGAYLDQVIKTGGKMKLGVAAAQMSYLNAQLALKRARSDLSTAVRTAYFTLLVDIETLVVTRALAQFTDDIYRLQVGLLGGMQAATYEPASLRAQAFTTRLAYKQAIASYIYDWKTLVATIGLHQLPLTQIAGRVDRLIPYYEYDEVLAYALQNHTDVLTARNTVKQAQYNLKLAQVTPLFPDVEAQFHLERDFTVAPFGTYAQFSVAVPVPIWDQNKGNIIAAQAALVRAGEESHRVETALANNLAAAYGNYKNNLYAMEYYRRYILPDLVRYYRGVFERRQIDPSAAFGDLVFAQQNLSTNVTSYIGVLQSLWTSTVNVADFLQTDDLFQFARPRPLPELPDFTHLTRWACDHPGLVASCADRALVVGPPTAAPGAGLPLSPPAGGVPAQPARIETGTPPSEAGDDAAPPPPPQGEQPPAAQRPADPTDRPPAPASRSERDGVAWLDRRRVPDTGLAKLVKSYFGKEEDHEGRVFHGPAALVKSYFGKEEDHEGQAF
jgi:cobalt-zinc-cadmium efflux system outer membrane protein